MTVIDQVKALLGLDDTLQDKLLGVIKELTEAHFKAFSQQAAVPDELNYIIVEVMVKRYNRLGSEGLMSQKVEGLDMAFAQNDFLEYESVIKRHFSAQFKTGVKFL